MINTVEPVYNGHLWDLQKWLLYRVLHTVGFLCKQLNGNKFGTWTSGCCRVADHLTQVYCCWDSILLEPFFNLDNLWLHSLHCYAWQCDSLLLLGWTIMEDRRYIGSDWRTRRLHCLCSSIRYNYYNYVTTHYKFTIILLFILSSCIRQMSTTCNQ